MRMQQAFDKYGIENCRQAYDLNRTQGEGANTIGHLLGFTTRQVDTMIDAYDEYVRTWYADSSLVCNRI